MGAVVAAGLLALLLGQGACTVSGPLQWVTDSFLFHPESGQHRDPSALDIPFEERWLVAGDGTRIQAWWMPGHRPDGSLPGVTIVTFHGNAGTMADRLEWCFLVHRLGVSVLAVEYRGYGDSEGSPSEEGLAQDALAGLAEARRLAEQSGDRVVAHGRSLGGAVAIRLAAEGKVDGLIAESTFTSMQDMAGRSGIPFARQLVAYGFDSEQKIREGDCPVLLVHGEADEVVPYGMGEQLRDAALEAGRSVSFLAVPGGLHNSTWLRAGDRYYSLLQTWLEALAPGEQASLKGSAPRQD